MKPIYTLIGTAAIIFLVILFARSKFFTNKSEKVTSPIRPHLSPTLVPSPTPQISATDPLWFQLHRKSNIEYLYQGVPGDVEHSQIIKTFKVKTGRPGERPTPLPELLGRKYWKITAKRASNSPETAPYFISLDIPILDKEPWGPVPYLECNGQCNWVLPGEFGLHGINGDITRLSKENPGSSGCIRHTDEDITYLYNLLEPTEEEIRYYVLDI